MKEQAHSQHSSRKYRRWNSYALLFNLLCTTRLVHLNYSQSLTIPLNLSQSQSQPPEVESQAQQPKILETINETYWYPTEQARTFFSTKTVASSCAIHLFGLPRAFKALVLPSLRRNVLPYNPTCDYFVHFYNVSSEQETRSGQGGSIHAEDIYELTAAVQAVNPQAQVHYISETDQEFQQRRATVLEQVSKEPYKPEEFSVATTWNIIRMWNSIQSSWELMERSQNNATLLSSSSSNTSSSPPPYRRVAFLRSDVIYINPVQIWAIPPLEAFLQRQEKLSQNKSQKQKISLPNQLPIEYDNENELVVVPSFASYPVNDRFIAGPYEAVRIWASQRFTFMDEHVHQTLPRIRNETQRRFLKRQKNVPLNSSNVEQLFQGIHDENYLALTIFPKIRQTPILTTTTTTTAAQSSTSASTSTTLSSSLSSPKRFYRIVEHESLCFFRARVDQTIWANDCEKMFSGALRRSTRRRSAAFAKSPLRLTDSWLRIQRYGEKPAVLNQNHPSAAAARLEGDHDSFPAVIQNALSPYQTCLHFVCQREEPKDHRCIFWQCQTTTTDMPNTNNNSTPTTNNDHLPSSAIII